MLDILLLKGAKVYPVSGRRSCKGVPVEDLHNKTPFTLHGDLVEPGRWPVINDPQTKDESLDWGPAVGGAPVYGFHPGPSRE